MDSFRSDFTVAFIFTVGICTFACPKVPKDLKGEYPLDNPPGVGSFGQVPTVLSDSCTTRLYSLLGATVRLIRIDFGILN